MSMKTAGPLKRLSYLLPNCARNLVKRIYLDTHNRWNRFHYVKLERLAYAGKGFRLNCCPPYSVVLGEETNVESWNAWEARLGNIHVGRRCWIGLNNVIMGPVRIEDEVSTGQFVCILGPRHALYGYDRVETEETTVIGRNAWISPGVIIHFGVHIGENAVIAPGAVVTKDVLPNTYVAGNPARDITKVSNLESLMKERARKAHGRSAPDTPQGP